MLQIENSFENAPTVEEPVYRELVHKSRPNSAPKLSRSNDPLGMTKGSCAYKKIHSLCEYPLGGSASTAARPIGAPSRPQRQPATPTTPGHTRSVYAPAPLLTRPVHYQHPTCDCHSFVFTRTSRVPANRVPQRSRAATKPDHPSSPSPHFVAGNSHLRTCTLISAKEVSLVTTLLHPLSTAVRDPCQPP